MMSYCSPSIGYPVNWSTIVYPENRGCKDRWALWYSKVFGLCRMFKFIFILSYAKFCPVLLQNSRFSCQFWLFALLPLSKNLIFVPCMTVDSIHVVRCIGPCSCHHPCTWFCQILTFVDTVAFYLVLLLVADCILPPSPLSVGLPLLRHEDEGGAGFPPV